jgi:hypothetical protein
MVTEPIFIENVLYKHYPKIDMSMSEVQISTYFIDTTLISNLFLSALGGDYDGDMVSIRMCYTQEANKEAEEIMKSLKNFISVQGKLIRDVNNEAILCFYSMTYHE